MGWKHVIKRLALGVCSILAASAVLLLSDVPRREATLESRVFRVALLQHVSQPIMEDGAKGVLRGLAEAGFEEGRNLHVQRFNAEGDLAVSNAIAQSIVHGDFDLAITLSTLSLQSLANANKEGRVRHVFALVTDPSASGVGIGRQPLDHPPHLTGLGTLQPVAESVDLARRFYPGLKNLGVVWNPGEVNSMITVKLCREHCKKHNITLLEANAENTSAVREAAASLVARGAEAFWIGGDVTVLAAIETLLGVTRAAKVPVITCFPGSAHKGSLIDLGANYFEVGRRLGGVAAQVLSGTSPAAIPVERFVPPKLLINLKAIADLHDRWTAPPEALAAADVVIDEAGVHEKAAPASTPVAGSVQVPLAKKWRVRILEYVNIADALEAERGVLEGLKKAGLQVGRDYEYRVMNAQGDMATLNGMVDAAVTENADLIITLSTPTLQAALRRAGTRPIVFTFLANPVAAGAGRSDTDHLPNVTGAYGGGDAEGMIALIRKHFPAIKRMGLLYTPTEVNSVYNRDQVLQAAQAKGLEVVSMGVDTPAETADATVALCGKSIDLVCLPTANLTASSFPSIIQATRRARMPVFAFLGGLAKQGAAVVLARDYYDMGFAAGGLAARVMRGESPRSIPLHSAQENRLMINLDAARQLGLKIPDEFVKSAQVVIGR